MQTQYKRFLTTDLILKRNKYYILSEKGRCKVCGRGRFGCCSSFIYLDGSDLNAEFRSLKDVKRLLDTGLFYLEQYGNYDNPDFYQIVLKLYYPLEPVQYVDYEYDEDDDGEYETINYIRRVCILWTENGCRLPPDARPRVCRTYYCGKPKHFNRSEKGKVSRDVYHTPKEYIVLDDAYMRLHPFEKDMSYEEYLTLDWNKIMKVL